MKIIFKSKLPYQISFCLIFVPTKLLTYLPKIKYLKVLNVKDFLKQFPCRFLKTVLFKQHSQFFEFQDINLSLSATEKVQEVENSKLPVS